MRMRELAYVGRFYLLLPSMSSGHFITQSGLQMTRPRPPDKIVSYRKYDAINMGDFSDELV